MFTEDYVMRMINQAIAALVYIVSLKKAGQYSKALKAIDQALEQLLGLKAELIKQLDDEGLFQALTQQDRMDIERLGLIADLFKEEGDIFVAQNQVAEGQESYWRALSYHLETGFADEALGSSPELTEKVEELVQKLGIQHLPDDLLWTLSSYFEQIGDYAKADLALMTLADRPDLYAETQPELIGFYERLLAKSPEELARGKLNKAQVQEKLAKAKQARHSAGRFIRG